MSDDPNDRAARLAGRWGGEDAADRDEEAAETGVDDRDEGESAESESNDPDADSVEETETGAGGDGGERAAGMDGRSDGGAGEGEGSDVGVGAGEDGDSEDSVDRELTTREMQSQMLYLPPAFHKEVDLTFEELNLRFRRERDRKLEKNKDFYLGLLQLGLEELGDVGDRELDEVEELLDL